MSVDPFAPVDGAASPAGRERQQPSWITVTPIPTDAPKPPASHPRLGKPVASWSYRSTSGELLGHVRRFETPDGKVFRPLTYAAPAAGGKPQWRWESWAPKRPLYGLDRLAQRPDAPVVVTEGEKAADAAGALLPDFVAVTSPNGSKSGGKADWSPLRGRKVTIWPDADVTGLDYANLVAKEAIASGASPVTIGSPPPGCKVGWDAADALADGWDEARAKELIANAAPAPNGGAADDGGSRRRTPQRDIASRTVASFGTMPAAGPMSHLPSAIIVSIGRCVRGNFACGSLRNSMRGLEAPLAARRLRMACAFLRPAPFTTVANTKPSSGWARTAANSTSICAMIVGAPLRSQLIVGESSAIRL